ncbi:MAG: hypothetical protein K8U57_29820 [Planctomycetes bacterium]|nr:hypothetical protein [Planctomycetota bacterium]
MFPIIPVLALVALFGGGATLYWYDALSRDEKARANRMVGDMAWQLFGKTVEELTEAEARHINNRIKQHFVS